MNDAWIGFTGVLIGSSISVGFQYFLDYKRRSEKERLRWLRKREKAYLEAIDILSAYIILNASIKKVQEGNGKNANFGWEDFIKDKNHEIIVKMQAAFTYMLLYATPKISNEYMSKTKDFLKRIGDESYRKEINMLIKKMRDELKIPS